MISVAVVGASGYVGSALAGQFERNPEFHVYRITRKNYSEMQKLSFNVLINSAMPSKRFWAKSHPEEDFKETVLKTDDLLNKWNYKKFVQISTVSARCEPDSIYGKHKAEAEKLCLKKGTLIARLSAMFSPDLSKGALVDILKRNKVFVSGDSRYPFASLDFISSWIVGSINLKGIVEVGAKNTVTLKEIAEHLGFAVEFEGPVEDQTLERPRPEFPDAKEVFRFMDQMMERNRT